MNTVAEIQAEIRKLKPEEIHELGRRIHELIKKLPRRSREKAVKEKR